ncbi:ADP-ribosylglycohydrolase family protein [Streptomyces sp. NPDC006464]|uniref:ADP-ribosylglycohydrolase family protein n=1 Tax=Streptomyces sp. NPDC006464 TaxID=3154305 RepID=UPI00339F8CAF
MRTIDRAVGAVLGSAVGDALGAPFEFGLPGVFRERFPDGRGEMCGGGGWDPGEATDDTQMAVLVGESLLERGGLDLPDIFRRFRSWAAADPKDIGLQTEAVLSSGDSWDTAAARHFQVNGRAAGNGSLMREGTALLHELVRVALLGEDPSAALPEALAAVAPAHRARWAVVLAPDWHPDDATEFNGAVWPCLGSAVWALRTTASFEEALAVAIDLGGDTDTVAAVTGLLAGAVHGAGAIPARWTEPLHVPLPGHGPRTLRSDDLRALATALIA